MANGLDKLSTTYGSSKYVDQMQRIGEPFKISKIRIPLGQAVAANMTLTVKAFFDDGSSNKTLATINTTNYASSERNIIIHPADAMGVNNFYLQLEWSGTALLTVNLPITIEVETIED